MKVFTLPDGSAVTASDQFEIGDQKYPPGWLESALDADIAAAGITVQVVADPAPVPPEPKVLAQAALDASDMTALRCFKAGVAFPPEWLSYTQALRVIVRNNVGDIPTQPVFPVGT